MGLWTAQDCTLDPAAACLYSNAHFLGSCQVMYPTSAWLSVGGACCQSYHVRVLIVCVVAGRRAAP